MTPDVTVETEYYMDKSGKKQPLRVHHPPSRGTRPAVIIYHGASPKGEEHPEVNRIANHLAKIGFRIFLPRLPHLKNVLVRDETVERIVGIFEVILGRKDVDPNRIVVVGLSFAGGLLIKACTDTRMRGRPVGILSYGSYFNLEKTLEYTLTGDFTDGKHRFHQPPHRWAKVVFFHNFLEHIGGDFSRENVRSYFLKYVQDDEKGAEDAYTSFPERDRAFIDVIMNSDSEKSLRLAEEALPIVRPVLQKLSPQYFLDDIDFPVCLMHGASDTMIPHTETVLFRDALRLKGKEVKVLISHVYVHSDIQIRRRGRLVHALELMKTGRFIHTLLKGAF